MLQRKHVFLNMLYIKLYQRTGKHNQKYFKTIKKNKGKAMKPSILQVAITTHNAWLHKVLSFLFNLCNLIPFGGSSVGKKDFGATWGLSTWDPCFGKESLAKLRGDTFFFM